MPSTPSSIACCTMAGALLGLSLRSSTLTCQPSAFAASTAPLTGIDEVGDCCPREITAIFLPLAASRTPGSGDRYVPRQAAAVADRACASTASAPVPLGSALSVPSIGSRRSPAQPAAASSATTTPAVTIPRNRRRPAGSANPPRLPVHVLVVHVVLDRPGRRQVVVLVDQHAAQPVRPRLLAVERAVHRVDHGPAEPGGVGVQREVETLLGPDQVEVLVLPLAADDDHVVLPAGGHQRRSDELLGRRRV